MEENKKNHAKVSFKNAIGRQRVKTIKCKICGDDSLWYDSAVILKKYKIAYFKCPHCGFIQTEEPYWLDEAYSSAITSSDIGLMQRNVLLSQRINILLRCGMGEAVREL